MLPFEKLEWKTTLTKNEIIESLTDVVETKRSFYSRIFALGSRKKYAGELGMEGFKLKRFRGSFFAPTMVATIIQKNDVLIINIKLKMNFLTIALNTLYYSLFSYLF